MTHRLSLSRAARLAGISRAVMQQKIGRGELPTFEGEVALKDLLRVFPDIDLESNTELDRVPKIKENAFGKRIQERVFPEPEILMSRLRVATQALAVSKMKLARFEKIIANLESLYQDHLHPGNKEFFVSGNDSILEAALGTGINLNWGCSNGNCGLCKAKLISSKTKNISRHDFSFSEADKNNNAILLCCHTPITNIEIEAEELNLSSIPAQTISCKVKAINHLAPDMIELNLQTSRSKRLRFFTGQSVSLSINTPALKSYPYSQLPL